MGINGGKSWVLLDGEDGVETKADVDLSLSFPSSEIGAFVVKRPRSSDCCPAGTVVVFLCV